MKLRLSRRAVVALFVVSQLAIFVVLRAFASWRPLQVQEPTWGEHLAYSPDGKQVAVCGFAGGGPPLRLRRTSDGKLLLAALPDSPLEEFRRGADNVLWAPQSQLLIASEHHLYQWNGETAKALFELAYLQEMALSPEGQWLVAAGQKGQGSDIVLWNFKTGRQQWRSSIELNQVQLALSRRYLCLTGAASDSRGAIGSSMVRVFDLPSQRMTRQFKTPIWYTNDIAISPSHPETLAISDNSGLSLINVRTGKRVAFFPFVNHAGALGKVAFSPDGRLLASAVSTSSGGPPSDILLFEIGVGTSPTLRYIRTLVGHSAWVTGLSFSPDGKTLASGGYDKVLRFWRVR